MESRGTGLAAARRQAGRLPPNIQYNSYKRTDSHRVWEMDAAVGAADEREGLEGAKGKGQRVKRGASEGGEHAADDVASFSEGLGVVADALTNPNNDSRMV